jgi:hypothetical protein
MAVDGVIFGEVGVQPTIRITRPGWAAFFAVVVVVAFTPFFTVFRVDFTIIGFALFAPATFFGI